MKKITLLLISLFLFSSCTSDQNTVITEKYSLINVSGGFAGVNENFAKGEIIWTFDTSSASLTVKKNTQNAYSGLSEGNYSYSIQNINDKQYIFINNIESGGVTNEVNKIIIDENEQSTGSGADGFIYQLEK